MLNTIPLLLLHSYHTEILEQKKWVKSNPDWTTFFKNHQQKSGINVHPLVHCGHSWERLSDGTRQVIALYPSKLSSGLRGRAFTCVWMNGMEFLLYWIIVPLGRRRKGTCGHTVTYTKKCAHTNITTEAHTHSKRQRQRHRARERKREREREREIEQARETSLLLTCFGNVNVCFSCQ